MVKKKRRQKKKAQVEEQTNKQTNKKNIRKGKEEEKYACKQYGTPAYLWHGFGN